MLLDGLKAVLKDAAGDPLFVAASAVAVVSALAMVLRRNPVYSALWLMVCFLSVAVIFLDLGATFLAAIHVIVYTGAILVLFLFVIMLLNLQPHELGTEHPRGVKVLLGICAAGLAGLLAVAFLKTEPPLEMPALRAVEVHGPTGHVPIEATQWGGVEHVGHELFGRFVAPFEIVSVLIVVAIIGAVVLAKRKA